MKSILKKGCLLLAILICSGKIFAQSNFVSGYVVKNNNDTLKGFLKADVEKNLTKQVIFSSNASGESQQTFTGNEVKAFYFNNGSLFENITYKDTANTPAQIFAKALLKGYYNLYSFRNNEIEYFVVQKDADSYLLFDDVILPNGTLDAKGNYRNQLMFLSRDCSKLQSFITTVRYTENELLNFISKLNNCIAPSNSNKSLYVKEKSEAHLFVFAGGLPLGSNKYEYTARIGARISVPSISKSTFVYIAATYLGEKSQVSVYGKQKDHIINVASIGITLQNNFTTGIIQPYLEVGVGGAYKHEKNPANALSPNTFQNKYGVDIIAALGIEGHITKSLVVKADWRYELLMHYPVIGIAYCF